MAKEAGRITRRAVLSAIAAAALITRRAHGRSAARYSAVVSPARALLGDRIVLELACQASEAADVATFEDASLMLGMARRSGRTEPESSFPNRKTVEEGSRVVRLAPVFRRRLQRGQRITREFDLVSTFPRLAIDSGEFEVHYEIEYEGQPRRVGPTNVTVESGPVAIPGLLALLSHEEAGVRQRAAGLVHRMTARVVGYSAEADVADRRAAIDLWKAWWERTGTKLPWNFHSVGATFGQVPLGAPRRQRSNVIGGTAYRLQRPSPGDAKAISSALVDWLRDPAAGPASLRGRELIADQTVHYPSDDNVVEPDEEIVTTLNSALSRLAEVARSSSTDARAVMLILATLAKMPDRRFVPPLEALRAAASKGPAWRRVSFIADGLLDVLDSSRTPVGDE
jgi:hypothetical protein